MVEIEIIGNIGREEEIINIKKEKSGANALRFSIAGQTGRGENRKTSWYTCFYNCDPSFKNYLHKGMKVFIRGEYSDTLYVNPRNNSTAIDRTISVRKLEFCDSKQEGQVAATAPVAPQIAAPAPTQRPELQAQTDDAAEKLPF